MNQLTKLAQPFPPQFVKKPPAGKYGSYVPHPIITQRLLEIVGPHDTEIKQVIYGAENIVEGVILKMTLEIDGKIVSIEEVGDCESPTNWKTNGARLKDAISDATKRCAMRFGLGLHLWAKTPDEYFLFDKLVKIKNSDGEERITPKEADELLNEIKELEPTDQEELKTWMKVQNLVIKKLMPEERDEVQDQIDRIVAERLQSDKELTEQDELISK